MPTTDNFLLDGKALILLNPKQDDRQALEDHLGATSLDDDSPALAVFNTYSEDRLLQTTDLVEFPATLEADAFQTDPPGSAVVLDGEGSVLAAAHDGRAALGEQAIQWRALFEGRRAEAKRTLGALSGVSPAQFASVVAAASRSDASPTLAAGAGSMDLASWLTPPTGIAAAAGSQFLTVQPFRVTPSYTLALTSIYYQDRFQSVYPKAVVANNVDCRGPFGFCCFPPINAKFNLPPVQTTYTNVTTNIQTYRILERNSNVHSHEIIAHQLITSAPTLTPAPPAPPQIGTETISFCTSSGPVGGPYTCQPNVNGCNAFEQNYDVSWMRGFNQQFVSTFTCDGGPRRASPWTDGCRRRPTTS